MTEFSSEHTTQRLNLTDAVDEPTTQTRLPGRPGSAPDDEPTTPIVAAALERARRGAEASAEASAGASAEASAEASVERGRTTVADEVVERIIEKIVDLSVEETPGVVGLYSGAGRSSDAGADHGGAAGAPAGNGAPAGGPEAGGARADDAGRAVSVRLDDDKAEIDLAIAVEFGHPVHEVVENLRTSVISGAERQLGVRVTEVNIVVADVSFGGRASRGD